MEPRGICRPQLTLCCPAGTLRRHFDKWKPDELADILSPALKGTRSLFEGERVGERRPTLMPWSVSIRACASAVLIVLAAFSETANGQAIVAIPDSSLSNAVRSALTQPGDPLTVTDLEGLTWLAAPGQGIISLSGLEWASNLTALNLAGNCITDLSPLGGLTNLATLNLGGNSINDLGALHNLNALTSLMLYNNGFADLSPLAALTNLSYLELRWNAITNCQKVLPGLTNLSTLYLGGNSLSNVTFLQGLDQLTFLDLDHNWISDISPLATLTNVSSLDLGYNRLTNFALLSATLNLSSLYLSGNSVTDVSVVQNLPRLTSLTVYSNNIENLLPLTVLSNLKDLGLSWNPVTNLDVCAPSFTNLSSWWLAGYSVTNLSFLQGLTRLEVVGVRNNALSNLAGLEGLTNLVAIHADYNRLTNDLQAVTSLPRLLLAGFVGNNLNTNAGSPEMQVIQSLEDRGVTVNYLPQNQPPVISVLGKWIIAANATASLRVFVSDDLTPVDRLIVTGSSSDTGLFEDANLLIYSTNYYRTLVVTPTMNQTGVATITLSVTDEGGLSANASVWVNVMVATNVFIADVNLLSAIQAASGNYNGDLTSVDLLNLSSLYVNDADLTGFFGWQWLTNLTSLSLGTCLLSNLDFVTNLTQLSSLSLEGNQVTDVSAVAGLTNLGFLDLNGNSISNLEFLTNLTQLNTLWLEDNRITDLSPLSALMNLNSLDLQQNLLTDVSPLTNLLQLQTVDVSVNLLDLSSGSDTAAAIQQLQDQGATVYDQPQREPPIITAPGFWFVSINTTSSLPFSITDNAVDASQLSVQAVSSDTNLLPNESTLVSGPDTNGNWTLTVTPAANQTGMVNLTLVATDDAGLSSDASIQVGVMVPHAANIRDGNLLAAILTMLGGSAAYVTYVDLLNLTELDAQYSGISDLSGLQGASNLAILYLDGNSLSDLSPLGGLQQLTSLSLSNNFIQDISSLAGLTNLNYLALGGNAITNWAVFLSGFSSLTSLDLAGSSISNLAFLQNLTQLTTLGLDDNWITDLSPLASLTNLASLSLQYNLLTNILTLTDLTQLSFVDVSFNYLGTSTGSIATSTIQSLQDQGATVYYLPQVGLQPEIQLELAVGPAGTQVIAYGVPGARYQFQTSTNLVDWAVLATVISTNAVMFYDVSPAAGACFYRIKALNP